MRKIEKKQRFNESEMDTSLPIQLESPVKSDRDFHKNAILNKSRQSLTYIPMSAIISDWQAEM